MHALIVIGIDPGTRHMGWGVVSCEGARLVHVASGVVSPPADGLLEDRLMALDEALRGVLTTFTPDASAVESLFFAKDAQAAAKLGHARGVILLGLRRAGLSIAEYAPAHVKRTIVGRGLADKHQVAMVVTAILKLSTPPPADAADALAVALTHARVARMPALALVARRGR